MVYFLALVAVLAFSCLVGYGIYQVVSELRSDKTKQIKSLRRQVRSLNESEHIAERSLCRIASGTSDPVLEASVCLDEMHAIQMKEIEELV